MTDAQAPADTAAARIAAALQAAVATDDRAAAWRVAELLAADWSARPLDAVDAGTGTAADTGTGTATDADRYTDADLDAAAAALGHPLPAALREALKLFGHRDDLTRSQDPLARPDELEIFEGALIFRNENQGVCWWGVLLEDLDQDDPPTYYCPDLADKAEQKWDRWTDRLSLAIIDALLAETVIAEVEDQADAWELDDYDPGQDPALTALPKIQPKWSEAAWYVGDDVLVYVPGGFLFVKARSPEALAAFTDDETEDDD
ncbi:hypothetical protein [Catenulispora pinisilvae]|uniref:hypothetical protein n=1 Tax=Catenulispora pinisilvae TaxID=2705253 RepID=UPI001892722F|nr:hypothetical protein [Catenulispora pinisilvae]